MKLFRRFVFFFIGVALGSAFVYYLFGDRDIDFSYGPQARTIKNIRSKSIDWNSLQNDVLDLQTDSLINKVLEAGDVRFGKSEPRKEPFGHYALFYSHESFPYLVVLENGDEVVKLVRVEKLPD